MRTPSFVPQRNLSNIWMDGEGAKRWLPNLGKELSALPQLFFLWQERVRQRQELQRLPTHMLHDIGLSEADVARESLKPFWRA
jgi:uncharacterized protein YjiS (DUF1127 family)